MEWILCRVVQSSCLLTHNIVPHISWHDLPYHRTTKKYEEFEGMVVSLLPPAEIRDSNMALSLSTMSLLISRCLWLQPKHDQGKMLVLPIRLLYSVLSTSDQCFVSFQSIWCHPHTQIRTILFDGVRRDIRNFKLFPNRVPIELSRIAFPITVLPKDDRKDCAREEQLGLPYWTMILAICVVVDESKSLDIPILEFSVILEHLPFLPGSAACPAQPGSLEMISMTFAAVICDADDLCSVNTA